MSLSIRCGAAGIAWRGFKRWQCNAIEEWYRSQKRALYWLLWVPLAFLGFKPNPSGKHKPIKLDAAYLTKVMQNAEGLLAPLKDKE